MATPTTPVITTQAQTVNYFGSGGIVLSGTCSTDEQFVRFYKGGTALAPAAFSPAGSTTWQSPKLLLSSGAQTFTADGYNVDGVSSESTGVIITGVDSKTSAASVNIITKVYDGLHAILDGTINGVTTVAADGEEEIYPAVIIGEIREEEIDRTTSASVMQISFWIDCITNDLYKLDAGIYDDLEDSDTKDGAAGIAQKVSAAVLAGWSTEVPELSDLREVSITPNPTEEGVTTYRIEFEGIYMKARTC